VAFAKTVNPMNQLLATKLDCFAAFIQEKVPLPGSQSGATTPILLIN